VPIPELDANGFLPVGLHDCTLDEVDERFGVFQTSDRRVRLFHALEEYVTEVGRTGMALYLLIDGSFVTSKPEPSDVDLILVLSRDHDFGADLRPFEYNTVTRPGARRVHRLLDLFVFPEGSAALNRQVRYFQGVRDNEDAKKGLLRVTL
jgi:hypothetical protein